MFTEMLFDDPRLDPTLKADYPKAAQLVEWAIQLNPELARKKPADAIKQVSELYMRALQAQSEWGKYRKQFAGGEIASVLKGCLRASIDPKKDTFCAWLGKNATNKKDQLKPGRNLLEAIKHLSKVGVATGKNDHEEWIVDKLQAGLTNATVDERGMSVEATVCLLTEADGHAFLRLRNLFREKAELQKEYAAWLASKSGQEKFAAGKKRKAAGK